MVEVIYKDHPGGKTPEARIQHRLKPSSPSGGQAQTETVPTRTQTTILYSGSQTREQKGNDNG